MKICIISKYPPIEGGVSSDIYWLAKALGEKGHEIFVVTNAWEVEKDFRIEISEDELCYLEPKNVSVHSTVKDFRPPILRSPYYTEKLVTLATDVIRKNELDMIHSYYILPYGVAGFITKYITRKPHILRHAGSDLGRLYKSKFLQTIFIESCQDADKIIGGDNILKMFKATGKHTEIFRPKSLINPDYFNPNVEAFDLSDYREKLDGPIFTYLGKVSELKKTYALVNAASKIKNKKFTLLFVIGDGFRAQELKKYVISLGLKDKCIFLPFQAPWKIPPILKASTCIVSPESEETPYLPEGTHHPKIVKEAMACGKCAIMGMGVAKKGMYSKLVDDKEVLVIDPDDVNKFKNKLEYVINNPSIAEEIGKNAYKFFRKNENFNRNVTKIEKLFSSVIN